MPSLHNCIVDGCVRSLWLKLYRLLSARANTYSGLVALAGCQSFVVGPGWRGVVGLFFLLNFWLEEKLVSFLAV